MTPLAHAALIDLLPFGSSTTGAPGSATHKTQQGTTNKVFGRFQEFCIEGSSGTGVKLVANPSGFKVIAGTAPAASGSTGYFILDGSQFNAATGLNPDADGLGTDNNGVQLVTLSDGGDRFQLNVADISGRFDVGVHVWSDGGANDFELVQSNVSTTGPLDFLFSDFSGVNPDDVSAMVFFASGTDPDSQIVIDAFVVPAGAVPTPASLGENKSPVGEALSRSKL